MPQTIFCDESGHSGNNLLDANQPYFTFATVALDPVKAQDLADQVRKEFSLTGPELKGQKLLQFSRGQKAVRALIQELAPTTKLSAWHKRYTLASKFFEYIFEPLLAANNKAFYDIGFHRFISNVIYHQAILPSNNVASLMMAFQQLIRDRATVSPTGLFAVPLSPDAHSEAMREIETFTVIQWQAISEELFGLSDGDPIYRWLLDLSSSALYALLVEWSLEYDSLRVICDDSKPLAAHKDYLDKMVKRPDLVGDNRPTMKVEGRVQHIGFNLSEPLILDSSANHPGIQLADVMASTLAYCLRNDTQHWARDTLRMLSPAISGSSVFPEPDVVDLTSQSGFINRLVLRQLVDRSAKGQDLIAGMAEFIQGSLEYWRRAQLGLIGGTR